MQPLTVRFTQIDSHTYTVLLESTDVGEAGGSYTIPYDADTWTAVRRALTPGFDIADATDDTVARLKALGDVSQLPEIVGRALTDALFKDAAVRTLMDAGLAMAASSRDSLPVQFRLGNTALTTLPWELLHYRDDFLLAGGTISLTRYPEGFGAQQASVAELPLRLLLVMPQPLDTGSQMQRETRRQVLHGLRRLDEQGAVIVEELLPPTYALLIEAVTNGGYHMVFFHAPSDKDQNLLLEEQYGVVAPVTGARLATAFRTTAVNMVLLGQAFPDGSSGVAPSQAATDDWPAAATTLALAGVPLVVAYSAPVPMDAHLTFLRQLVLSISAGKAVSAAVSDARRPLDSSSFFVPALFGRPGPDDRLFDPSSPLTEGMAELSARLASARREYAALEASIGDFSSLTQPKQIAALRAAKHTFAQARSELAQQQPGGYTVTTSPLYGVPTNDIFVGRSAEVVEVSRTLAREHPVVVWGVGGIGKSALATEVAHRQRRRFPGGVLWLDCGGSEESGPAFDTLLNQMGAFAGLADVEEIDPTERRQQVLGRLAALEDPVLLIWDNAESVWHDRRLREFIGQLPRNVQVLITTRDNPQQVTWKVVELGALNEVTQRNLFETLAGQQGIKITRAVDVDAVDAILKLVEGHPLALILIIPLAAKRGLQRVWRDLQEQPLKGIKAAFAVSVDRISAEQRQLFMYLSVFSIPFEWGAAQAMLPDGEDVDEELDVLVQRSLVQFDGARYTFHALVRQFAYARLREDEVDVRPVHRLAAKYLRSKITGSGGTPAEALEEVDQWERAQEWKTFARRTSGLVGSLDRLGYWDEIDIRLQRAQGALQHMQESTKLDAQLLSDRGVLALKSARWDEAIEWWQACLKTYTEADDEAGMASTYNNLGSVYARKGEWDRAVELYEQSLATKERVGDIRGMARTMGNLGNFYQSRSDTDQAARYMAQAYLLFANLGAHERRQAAQLLVDILGSADAAHAYLQQFVQEQDEGTGSS